MQQEIMPLDHLAVMEFRGHDAGQFLQSQLTADVAAITGETAGFACCCNPSGRVLGLLLLRHTDDGFLAICAADLATELEAWLGKYILRSRVEIMQRPDLVVTGPLERPEVLPGALRFASGHGVYTVAPAAAVAGLKPAPESVAAFRSSELLAGAVWLGEGSSGQFLPQMLGLERIGALSFRKGCYPGQEVIARTRYLGKLKRHPVLCLAEGALQPAILAKAELLAGELSASAVVVDCLTLPGPSTLLFLVARIEPGVKLVALRMEEADHPLKWSAQPGPEAVLP
jgi:folate-binding protein YgfZ